MDNTTGLMWEKKLADDNAACAGANQASPNVHCVDNTYTWSAAEPFSAPTGTLYTDFLAKLNSYIENGAPVESPFLPLKPCFAGHCDWRIPNIFELQSILASSPCSANACLDAAFGPPPLARYWSSSSTAGYPRGAWGLNFGNGYVFNEDKNAIVRARAVRGGR